MSWSYALQYMNFVLQDISKSLKELLTYTGDVENDIMATFEISYEVFGETVNHQLVPDGKDKPVTKDNREVWSDPIVHSAMSVHSENPPLL